MPQYQQYGRVVKQPNNERENIIADAMIRAIGGLLQYSDTMDQRTKAQQKWEAGHALERQRVAQGQQTIDDARRQAEFMAQQRAMGSVREAGGDPALTASYVGSPMLGPMGRATQQMSGQEIVQEMGPPERGAPIVTRPTEQTMGPSPIERYGQSVREGAAVTSTEKALGGLSELGSQIPQKVKGPSDIPPLRPTIEAQIVAGLQDPNKTPEQKRAIVELGNKLIKSLDDMDAMLREQAQQASAQEMALAKERTNTARAGNPPRDVQTFVKELLEAAKARDQDLFNRYYKLSTGRTLDMTNPDAQRVFQNWVNRADSELTAGTSEKIGRGRLRNMEADAKELWSLRDNEAEALVRGAELGYTREQVIGILQDEKRSRTKTRGGLTPEEQQDKTEFSARLRTIRSLKEALAKEKRGSQQIKIQEQIAQEEGRLQGMKLDAKERQRILESNDISGATKKAIRKAAKEAEARPSAKTKITELPDLPSVGTPPAKVSIPLDTLYLYQKYDLARVAADPSFDSRTRAYAQGLLDEMARTEPRQPPRRLEGIE